MISGEGRLFELVRCETDEEWREERKRGLGASDIGAVMGLNRYRSPYEVWLEKTRRVEPEDISGKPVVAFGNDFEEIAGRNFEKAHPGSKVRRVNAMCRSIARPYMRASLDFECRLPGKDGWGVLEVKTTRDRRGFEESLLDCYTAQVVQQLCVTGRSWGVIWAFFRDTCEYRAYPVKPDDADRMAVMDAAAEFWGFVERDEPPELVGMESESRALFGQHPEGAGDMEPADCDADCEEIADISAEIAELESRRRLIQNRLKGAIGDAQGCIGEMHQVKWVRTTQVKFDRKRFERDHPDLAAEYEEEAPRDMGLRITELKGVR